MTNICYTKQIMNVFHFAMEHIFSFGENEIFCSTWRSRIFNLSPHENNGNNFFKRQVRAIVFYIIVPYAVEFSIVLAIE